MVRITCPLTSLHIQRMSSSFELFFFSSSLMCFEVLSFEETKCVVARPELIFMESKFPFKAFLIHPVTFAVL